MKKLEYKGYTFFYEIKEFDCGDYGIFTCYETIFYKYLGKATKKKYWLWGGDVEYDDYEEWFTLDFNIESCKITKEEINKKLDKQIALIKRCEEIKNGDIV